MLEAVANEHIFEKALKRDGYCCASCGLTPENTVLEVVWSKEVISDKERRLRNAITLCPMCVEAPEKFRMPTRSLGARESIEVLSKRKHQLEQYEKMEKRKAASKRKVAATALESLSNGHKWSDADVNSTMKFINNIGIVKIQNAIGITVSKKATSTPDVKFKYFCGIYWNMIKES